MVYHSRCLEHVYGTEGFALNTILSGVWYWTDGQMTLLIRVYIKMNIMCLYTKSQALSSLHIAVSY